MHCVSRGGCYLVNAFCDLQEENQHKERYQACWLGLVLETWPQTTLSETDGARRQRYEQQRVVHFLVQRSPDQTLTLSTGTGTRTETVTQYRLPLLQPRSSTDPQPARPHPKPLKTPIEPEPEGGELDSETKKPEPMNFRPSGFMSSPRETSHRVQKRE
uniref:Telethonin n=1 Tax=Sphaeramia orbicularis TaxID=375764 RepID=A0A672ZZP1_9TELE